MKYHQTFTMIALIALLFSPSHLIGEESGPLSPFNDQQLKKLQVGEPVCEYKQITEEGASSAGSGQCSIILNKPIDHCFELFLKVDRQVHYVPGKTKSKIVDQSDGKLLIDNEYSYFGTTTKYHSIYAIDQKNQRLEFEIDQSKPHDLAENSGFWQFEKIDEANTLLIYGAAKLDLGVSVPEFIKKFLLGRSLPMIAINAKKYLESNGKWRQEK